MYRILCSIFHKIGNARGCKYPGVHVEGKNTPETGKFWQKMQGAFCYIITCQIYYNTKNDDIQELQNDEIQKLQNYGHELYINIHNRHPINTQPGKASN